MLLRHFDSPTGGTEVLASELSKSPDRDLNELLRALDLDHRVVAWQLQDVQARASERERALRQRNGAKTQARLDGFERSEDEDAGRAGY